MTLRNLISSGRRASITGIARLLHVTPQAASEMVHRLVAEGLVEQGDGRELTLTGRGRTIADAMFRRHAFVEWLLIEVIGMGWAESDEEAQRLQGAISEHVGASLDDFLGHPETCPHGNPIDAAAALRRPAGVALNSLASGSARRPSTASPRRPRRTRRCSRTSRHAVFGRVPPSRSSRAARRSTPSRWKDLAAAPRWASDRPRWCWCCPVTPTRPSSTTSRRTHRCTRHAEEPAPGHADRGKRPADGSTPAPKRAGGVPAANA